MGWRHRRLSLDRSASQKQAQVARLKGKPRNPTRQGLAESCSHQQETGYEFRISPDESGRLFLGGLLASRARLRFTGRRKSNSLDRCAMPEKRRSEGVKNHFAADFGVFSTAPNVSLRLSDRL
jgi:hypothetical protein